MSKVVLKTSRQGTASLYLQTSKVCPSLHTLSTFALNFFKLPTVARPLAHFRYWPEPCTHQRWNCICHYWHRPRKWSSNTSKHPPHPVTHFMTCSKKNFFKTCSKLIFNEHKNRLRNGSFVLYILTGKITFSDAKSYEKLVKAQNYVLFAPFFTNGFASKVNV